MADQRAAYAGAVSASRASALLTRDPVDVLLLLHEELGRTLLAAKTAYEARTLDQMCRCNERSVRILAALRAAMDFKAAGPDGAALERLYLRISSDVMRVLNDDNATETYQSAIETLQSMCRDLQQRRRLAMR